MEWIELLLILSLFAAGVRLSAFFSGSETGFYRLSLPRLGIDAGSGDSAAQRLLWFARHPANFVATTLIGNNVANYLTTLAISLGLTWLVHTHSNAVEILATLVMSPVIFLFGELLPKNIYYRAPMHRMRQEIRWFDWVYRICLPFSLPLVGLNRLLERFSGTGSRPTDLLLGRSRLVQMLGHGHKEGVLTGSQSRLANGVLQIATQPVEGSMMPLDRLIGVSESADRDEVLQVARKYGLPVVPIYRNDDTTESDWHAFYRTAEVAVDARPLTSLKHVMPSISIGTGKLAALQTLREASSIYGCIINKSETMVGIISERGLIEQLFTPLVSTTKVPVAT